MKKMPPTPDFFSQQVFDARRFYLQLRPANTSKLTVISGGWERCTKGYQIERKTFPYYALEYVAGGSGVVTINQTERKLRRGAIFVYGPDVRYEMRSDANDGLSKYFVDFVGAQADKLLQAAGLKPGTLRTVVAGDDIQKGFEDLLRSGKRCVGNPSRLPSLYLEALILTIAESNQTLDAKRQRAYATYTRCRQYIESNFLDVTKLEEAAHNCHIDTAYLCRLFSDFEGHSPYNLLLKLKMNHAASLLEGGRLMVREVADALKMDAFHFSRAFKRVHGLSPTAFINERMAGNMPIRSRASNPRDR